MGYKIRQDVCAIPTEIKDGILKLNIGYDEHEVHIPELKGYDFPRQCIQYVSRNVRVLLENDEYGVVLRKNSIGSLYLKQNKIHIKSFNVAYGFFDCVEPNLGGKYKDIRPQVGMQNVKLCTFDGKNFVLSIGQNISMHFNKEQNSKYLNSIHKYMNIVHPTVTLFNNKLYVINDETFDRITEIKGEISISDRVRLL